MLLNAFPMNTGDNIDFATILCTLLPLTLPFTVLFMLLLLGADYAWPHVLNPLTLPSQALMFSYKHSKLLTTLGCLVFILGHICYNLIATVLQMIWHDLFRAITRLRRSNLHHWRWELLFFMLLSCLTPYVVGADDSSFGMGPPMFKATKAHYMVWFTAWCGWLSMKYPELIDVLQGDEEEPDAADEDAHTDWWKKNKRLYGALVMSVPTSLKTSLNANARFNGIEALEILRNRFGVVDASDRASALKRVQKSYITPGAAVSVKDITRQYDRMTEAHAEYTDAGGNEIDDEMMRSYLLSALPAAYLQIKTVLRSGAAATFDELYNDLLKLVKQHEDDVEEHRNTSALYNQQQQQQNGQYGNFFNFGNRGGGKGGGGRGGRGGGRGGRGLSFVTCLRCGVLGHARNMCQEVIKQCVYCMADHLSALCPMGPGGAQRDALTPGAQTLLQQDVAQARARNAAHVQTQWNTNQQTVAGMFNQLQLTSQVAPSQAGNLAAGPPSTQPPSQTAVPQPPTSDVNGAGAMDDQALFQAFVARFPQFGGSAVQHNLYSLNELAHDMAVERVPWPFSYSFRRCRAIVFSTLSFVACGVMTRLRGGGGNNEGGGIIKLQFQAPSHTAFGDCNTLAATCPTVSHLQQRLAQMPGVVKHLAEYKHLAAPYDPMQEATMKMQRFVEANLEQEVSVSDLEHAFWESTMEDTIVDFCEKVRSYVATKMVPVQYDMEQLQMAFRASLSVEDFVNNLLLDQSDSDEVLMEDNEAPTLLSTRLPPVSQIFPRHRV